MNHPDSAIQFQLNEDLWNDMVALEGQSIASLVLWDSSLVDADLDSPPADHERIFVDCELYLANQTLLELYGVAIAPEDAEQPLQGLEDISNALEHLAEEGAVLLEVAADQDDALVLTVGSEEGNTLLLAVTAWLESTWDELPDQT